MNEAQHTYWSAYLKDLQAKLRLSHWELRLSHKPCDKGNMAECGCVPGQLRAKIALGKKWEKYSPECQRQTIVHELVHLYTSPVHYPIHRVMDDVAQSMHSSNFEYMVDALAEAIAPFMPLPFCEEEDRDARGTEAAPGVAVSADGGQAPVEAEGTQPARKPRGRRQLPAQARRDAAGDQSRLRPHHTPGGDAAICRYRSVPGAVRRTQGDQ